MSKMYEVRKTKYGKFSEKKKNIPDPLICTHTCAYEGVRNVRLSENL